MNSGNTKLSCRLVYLLQYVPNVETSTGALLLQSICFNELLRCWHSGAGVGLPWTDLSHVVSTSPTKDIKDLFCPITSHWKEVSYQAVCAFSCLFLTGLCFHPMAGLPEGTQMEVESWTQGSRTADSIALCWPLSLLLSWKSHSLLLHWFSPEAK